MTVTQIESENTLRDMSERIQVILNRMATATERCGRKLSDVTLIAVSKTKPLAAVMEAARTGLVSDFGENRVQEGMEKIPSFPADLHLHPCWHLIGHLQRNKARKALELFDVIESLDSVELAATLERICAEKSQRANVLMEVNSSHEASKTGIAMGDAPELSDFVVEKCPHLMLKGLMTVGPLGGNESEVRSAFQATRTLKETLQARSGLLMPSLSMGMSGDFEWAIEEGSTQVRVGTAIFGQRQYLQKQ